MRRIAEIHPRESSGRDGDRTDGCVIILAFETPEEVLHLCDRCKVILAAGTLCGAAPEFYANAVYRAVGLHMAVRRRVVDRDLERRVLSRGETGEDEENERGREAANESRAAQAGMREGHRIADQANVIREG
jgi:hypothetical protein